MMENINMLKLSVFVLVLMSCSFSQYEKKHTDDRIVIIFDSVKSNYDTITFESGAEYFTLAPVLNFIPSDKTEEIAALYKISSDMLNLKLKSDWLIVNYRFNPMSRSTFCVNKGDTVVIKHIDGVPSVMVANRITTEMDINYDFLKRNRYELIDRYSVFDHLQTPSYLKYKAMIDKSKDYENIRKKLPEKALEELKNEHIWIDSLKKENLFSEQIYQFISQKNKYALALFELSKSSDMKGQAKRLLSYYNDSVYNHDIYTHYINYYRNIVNLYYLDKNKGNDYDYQYAYSQLKADGLVYGKLKEDILSAWIAPIINQTSSIEGKKYYTEILSQLSDTLRVASLKERYNTQFDETLMHSAELELMDRSKQQIKWQNLLSKCKGKIVYVDFWASWCAPCMSEMPKAKILRQKYAKKNIVFIYLALNDREKEWQAASLKAELENEQYNYLILNSKTAPMIKDLKITSIPRYLIYDKDGKLIYRDALRPSSNELEKVLGELL